jgi:alpha-tubulin suppressor-like RCC1 family protein
VTASVPTATAVQALTLGGVTDIAAGQSACALVAGSVFCWGPDDLGQVGQAPDAGPSCGGAPFCSAPQKVDGVPSATHVAAGAKTTCALSAGQVWCFGDNSQCTLGQGASDTNVDAVPIVVQNLSGVTALAMGAFHVCALSAAGVSCWGSNASGEVGHDPATDTSNQNCLPSVVSGVTGVKSLAAGGATSCALLMDGTVTCWGSNAFGQLGTGAADNGVHATPAAVPALSNVVDVAVSATFACAALGDGSVRCWGANLSGSLGHDPAGDCDGGGGGPTCILPPTAVPGVTGAVKVSAGNQAACAVLSDTTVRCWGADNHGQLGNGATNASSNPPSPVLH